MNLLNLAPDIQEALLFLPRTLKGRDSINEKDVRQIAGVPYWSRQRAMWAQLVASREQEPLLPLPSNIVPVYSLLSDSPH